jgi:two-component sensor histidine kinase
VISPVRGDTGELLYFFASQSDASGKKRTRDELEEAVVARTRDLQSALDQKTVLLHEVDHRVKNNLQVISSLVLLKARRMRDPAVQRALHNMAERISALSTVHRLLYSAGDVSRFDIRAFITDLAEDLLSGIEPGRVALRLEVGAIGVSAAKATPLALLVNELVTNAVRHAFPDQRRGTLRVAASVQDGELRLAIEDDGVGVAGQAPSPEGFGRTLVDMLVRQLRGTIAWQDTEPGTRAVVVVPLDTEEAQL